LEREVLWLRKCGKEVNHIRTKQRYMIGGQPVARAGPYSAHELLVCKLL
jgi:hypothetical protein